jgi:PAS domain S-box-containing protein
VGWIIALVAVAAAAGLRFALDPWLAGAQSYLMVVDAVLFALIVGMGVAMHAARRRAEASEEKFRRFMENAPVAVFLRDEAGRYAYMNPAAQNILGAVDWQGKTDAQLMPAAAARQVRASDAKVLESDAPAAFELQLGERHLHATKFPLRDAAGRRFVGDISIDLTEAVRAAEELRRQREDLRIVTDTMSAGVVRVSADLNYVWVNRVFASWVGKSPGEIIGRPIGEVIGERDWRELRPHVERALRGERVESERRFGASERWIHSVMEPTRDENGAPNGLVAVVSDIHDRKLMEETLREAERRKDEFLATLAHELRNPLAPIRNAVAILGKKDALDPELSWSREVIERQVDQMSRLIDDLLDIARIAGGKLLIRKERLPLERAIDMALETSRPYINAAGHSLSVLLPSERVTVDADPARLAQVFSNLLNNAARYTERHGEIALTAEVDRDEVVVCVQDNGIGFRPEVAGRLFEPFSQLTRSNERSHGGLGIGLSLVQGIVALHGGSVEARSGGPGQGAEFVVRLPLPKYTDPVREAKPAAQAKPQASIAGVKVLVADDNRDAADSLQRILSHYGYQVEVAYDGTAAIRLDGAFRPKVAVLDIGMPGANGFEVARSIRDSRGDGVTLIALTGWGQEGDRRRAMEAGFDYHLTKPVDPGALNDLLVEVAK